MTEFLVWILEDDIERYNYYLEKCENISPFHLTEYLLAEAQAEDGITKIFLYEEEGKFAIMPEVVRKINKLPYMSDLNEELYDMIVPHEYGGIIANSEDSHIKEKLLEQSIRYCEENSIIFHFIRLNPYFKEQSKIFRDIGFKVELNNHQVYVDLKQSEEQIIKAYKPNVRRNIKRAESEGLYFEVIDVDEKSMNRFQDIYKQAMDILGARKFLYFNKVYFNRLSICKCSRLAVVKNADGRIVAGCILLLLGGIVYYHLGCFDREYSDKRPMNYLMHSAIMWSRREGYKIYHIGGGGEGLMQFKTGYSATRIDYYIASKVLDKRKYDMICARWKQQFPKYVDKAFYPLYRYNE